MFAKTTLSVLAALAFAASAHAAPAGSRSFEPDITSVRVSVADLNLGSRAGARTVLRRIHNAASEICGDEPETRQLGRAEKLRTCMKTTVDRAVVSLGNPTVTALNGGPARVETIVAASR
jgi:UrcA family protein